MIRIRDPHRMSRQLFILTAALMAGGAAHADTRLAFASGLQYSDGEYGETTSTRALFVPFRARLTQGAWAFQVSVPWVRVTGPTSLVELLDDDGGLDSHGGGSNSGSGSSGGDDDENPEPPPLDPDREVSGMGDTSLSVTYSLPRDERSPLYADLRGRVRLPTGSRRDGLGTGSTDYALLTEIGLEARPGGAYLSGGRRFLGPVDGVERVDGWQAGAGAWWNASPHVTLGVDYDWRDPSTTEGVAPESASAWIAWRVNDVWKIELNGGAGLSDAAPDYSAGISFTWRSGPF